MQKSTQFSKSEVVLVAVNSIITKLFLIFPATLVEIGKSASIVMALYISVIGYVILLLISYLYKCFESQSIITLTRFAVGKHIGKLYAIVVSVTFVLINGLFLRCVSESIRLSLMPNTDVNVISLIFIVGVCVAVFSGLKAIVRCHAIIVPLTLFIAAILFAGSVGSFEINNIYPLLGDGIASFITGSLLCSYFTDFFVVFMLLPYMDKSIKLKSIVNKGVLLSTLILLLIVTAVLLSVENNTLIPVFRLGQNFKLYSYTPRLESVFTAAWFLSFYLNFSLLLYYSCRLICKKYKRIIVPLAFVSFAISIIPKDIYELSKWLDYLSLCRLSVFFVLPVIILIVANVRRNKV